MLEHFLRFILPFSFAPGQAAPVDLKPFAGLMACEEEDKNPMPSGKIWQCADSNSETKYLEFLFPFFQRFLSQVEEKPTCWMFTMPPDLLQKVLPKRPLELWSRAKRLPHTLRFSAAHLFLFCTGVGFLVLEVQSGERNVSTENLADLAWRLRDFRLYEAADGPLVEANDFHYMRHKDKRSQALLFRLSSEDRSRVIIPPQDLNRSFPHPFLSRIHQRRENNEDNAYDFPSFTLAELILFLLNPLIVEQGIVDEEWLRTKCLINKYLIGYHFLRTKPYADLENKALDLFRLRRNYKDTYQASKVDLRLINNPEVIATFQNICFGQSQEGGVVLVEDIDHDFYRTFGDKAQFSYFLPFLLALHQRFALIHFAISMAELKTDDSAQVRSLRESILNFVLKWRFGQVSNVTMYNRVYENWRRVLGLDTLLQEIKSEVDELDELLERRASYKEDKRSRKLANSLTSLNLVLFPFLLLSSILGMNVFDFSDGSLKWSLVQALEASIGILVIYYLLYFLVSKLLERDE